MRSTLRWGLRLAPMLLVCPVWGHAPIPPLHPELIEGHLRHKDDWPPVTWDLEGSSWRMIGDHRGYYDNNSQEQITWECSDWDWIPQLGEEGEWWLDDRYDFEWSIAATNGSNIHPTMHADSEAWIHGLTESSTWSHTMTCPDGVQLILRPGTVYPYVDPGQTPGVFPGDPPRAYGTSLLTATISNYNDVDWMMGGYGEYDIVWTPAEFPGEIGYWYIPRRRADTSLQRTMEIVFCGLWEETQHFDRGEDLQTHPQPDLWPDTYTWYFTGLSNPLVTNTQYLPKQLYVPLLNNATPPISSCTVTVTAEGDRAASMGGGQDIPEYRISDSTTLEIM